MERNDIEKDKNNVIAALMRRWKAEGILILSLHRNGDEIAASICAQGTMAFQRNLPDVLREAIAQVQAQTTVTNAMTGKVSEVRDSSGDRRKAKELIEELLKKKQ